MRLKNLLAGILEVTAHDDCEIHGLSQDTRILKAGDLFFAYPGHLTDGRKYISEAVQKGAAAIITIADGSNSFIDHQNLYSIPILFLDNLNARLGDIAAKFYDHPAQNMTLIGVTGTNGKTTCAHFIAACVAKAYQRCGVIGSISNGYYDTFGYHTLHHNSYHLTTPHAFEIHYLLSLFKQHRIQKVVIEISSHALDQYRINGLVFQIAAFTNLSHDHLDYHPTMDHYAKTKKRLFEMPQLEYAVFNIDDPYGKKWQGLFANHTSVYRYTMQALTNTKHRQNLCSAQLLSNPANAIYAYLKTPWGQGYLKNSKLVGQFMLSNLLLVMTVLGILNIPFQESLWYLKNLEPVKGRMEKLGGTHDKPMIVIDYAHTPDALQTALQTLKPTTGFLWCIFGCGGNRDRKKRPLMGSIAEHYADRVILTQDNPRYENSQQIIEDILAGLKNPTHAMIQSNRQEAIYFAIKQAQPQDIILIAGKGHEDYQIVGDTELPFNDYAVAKIALENLFA